MYNNVLLPYRNSGRLGQVIIIGNHYTDVTPAFKQLYHMLSAYSSICNVTRIDRSGPNDDLIKSIFNDTYIMAVEVERIAMLSRESARVTSLDPGYLT